MAAKGGVMGSIKKVALAAAIAAVAAAVIAPAASANEYPGPPPDARTFHSSPGGYTSSVSHTGACLIPPLVCPAVSNTWEPSGGVGLKPPDGFLRTAIGSVAGVLATSTGTWESPNFKYRGFKGAVPSKILFHMRQRAGGIGLLSAGGDATYHAEIVRASDGVTVNEPWDVTSLTDRPNWTILPRINIGNGGMDINGVYFIRITTTYSTGLATVIPGAFVDYDNVIIQTFQ
jgi:hypothetical protein